jgi:protein SCO1/2
MERRGVLTDSIRVVALAVAAALVALGCAAGTNRGDPDAEVKRSARDPKVLAHGALEPRGGLAWRDYFPNVELTTHNGERVRFYDDLVKGKVVVINFMYATCTDS